jgi:hypothetical protein
MADCFGGADLLYKRRTNSALVRGQARSHKRTYSTFSSSTSNTRVALGGITPPAPRVP